MEDKFATELLKEIKTSAKRWFIAFIIVLSLWFATIGAFIWYISLPVEVEENTQSIEDAENNDIRQVIGGDYNEGNTEFNKGEKSSTE